MMHRRHIISAMLGLAATCAAFGIATSLAGGPSPQLPVKPSAYYYYLDPEVYHCTVQIVVDGEDTDAPSSPNGWTTPLIPDSGVTGSLSLGSLLAGTNFCWRTVAASGQTLAMMIANAPANVDRLLGARGDAGDAIASSNVVFGPGPNDGAASVATIEAQMQAYGAARKAAGWTHVICHGLAQASTVPQATYETVNAWLEQTVAPSGGGHVSWCDQLVDVSSDTSQLGKPNAYADTTWYNSDQKTLSQNGTTRWVAGMPRNFLRALVALGY